MVHVYAEYNGDYLTPAQIEFLHANLTADIAGLAAMDAEPEPDAEAEAEAGPEPEMELEL